MLKIELEYKIVRDNGARALVPNLIAQIRIIVD